MNHLSFKDKDTYSIALLIKESAFKKNEIQEHYPIDLDDTICLSLQYDSNGKAPVSLIKEVLSNVLKVCKHLQVKTLFVCDTAYFKTLTKLGKAEPHYGSIVKCAITGYDFDVILCPNYQALFYNPSIQAKVDLAIATLDQHTKGTHTSLGLGIIHFEAYPDNLDSIKEWLYKLLKQPFLTCDIETLGLALDEAELASISFAWNQHKGIAFLVSPEIKPLLVEFFRIYEGTLIFHRATFDITHLVFRLFMKDYLDYSGLLDGLHTMTKSLEDSQVITYLATNSTAGNDLKLKNLALEFAGNYGILDDEVTVKDIPTDELLKYNLVDTLATWYVYNKYKPIMIADNQLDIYESIMLPSIKSIVHMQLIGFPMEYSEIKKASKELNKIQKRHLNSLSNNKLIQDFEWLLQKEAFIKKNKELKKKYIPISGFKTSLNSNSGIQVAKLLYEYLEFPIINTTDTGLPATDKDTLIALYNQLIQEFNINESEL
jgi:DNA polymerase-1